MALLERGNPLRQLKEERLAQIKRLKKAAGKVSTSQAMTSSFSFLLNSNDLSME